MIASAQNQALFHQFQFSATSISVALIDLENEIIIGKSFSISNRQPFRLPVENKLHIQNWLVNTIDLCRSLKKRTILVDGKLQSFLVRLKFGSNFINKIRWSIVLYWCRLLMDETELPSFCDWHSDKWIHRNNAHFLKKRCNSQFYWLFRFQIHLFPLFTTLKWLKTCSEIAHQAENKVRL